MQHSIVGAQHCCALIAKALDADTIAGKTVRNLDPLMNLFQFPE